MLFLPNESFPPITSKRKGAVRACSGMQEPTALCMRGTW